MTAPSKEARKEFEELLSSAIKADFPKAKVSEEQLNSTIKYSDSEFGDLSSSVSFLLAKDLKKNPKEIAASIAKKAKNSKLISSISDASGYLNAKIDISSYSKLVIDETQSKKDKYGSGSSGKGKKVLLESPSVNPNKPWHIGHLRNALLGDTLSNLMEACSYDVEREDYIDDLGLQVAESLWGYMHLGNKPDRKFDLWLGEQYVLVNKKMAEDSKIGEHAKELVKKMEEHGTKENKLLKEISEKCVTAQYETSFNYDIYHDVLIWESDIVRANLLSKAISMALEKGAAEKVEEGKYAGCTIVNLEKLKGTAKELENPEEDSKVLMRSNGSPTYLAKDLAFHMWKFGIIDYQFDYKKFIEKQPNGEPLYTTSASGKRMEFGNVMRAINIIGSEQKYQQIILKSIFALMGDNKAAENLIHVAYGRVSLSEGSLSGRSGGWIGDKRNYTADSLLDEVSKKAKEIVEQSNKITDKSKIDEIAKAVALSAIKFDFIRIAPEKDLTFSWEKALQFEGDTGPYCMYTYARATRLLEKAGAHSKKLSASDYKLLGAQEFKLLKLISFAEETVEKACREYRPNVITDYLIDLSTAFSKFYETVPVLNSGEAEGVRLALVSATTQTIGNMLRLLGVKPIERM